MAVAETSLPLPLLRRGKVRDVYDVDADRVLLVATDRISAFDVVMDEPVPYKGIVLTQLTAWWLSQLEPIVRHHLLAVGTEAIIREVPALAAHAAAISGRSMLCVRSEVFPVECVVRGYISGSAWKEYLARGTLAGEALPAGLTESAKLPAPLFSPATKAEKGHDENITTSMMAELIGAEDAAELENLARKVYDFGLEVAGRRGIIIADTKLEFGYAGTRREAAGFEKARVILVDEVLTPDSSRFWPADRFEPGRAQPSFDKQPLRDYLEAERRSGRWNGEYPAPPLPAEVVDETSERYLDLYRRLTLSPLNTGNAN